MPPRAACTSLKDFLVVACAGALLAACSQSAWPEREGRSVEGVPVDSLKILPIGSRFVLADSATGIRFGNFRKGFDCARVTDIGLDRRADSVPQGFQPRLALQLPASGECAIDSGSDTTVAFVFRSADAAVLLFGSGGHPTDSAAVIRGRMDTDSLVYVADSLKGVTQGRFTFLDSAGILPRRLRADTLAACEALNQADFKQSHDTTWVRYTWVTLDSCAGGVHSDSVTAVPRPIPSH